MLGWQPLSSALYKRHRFPAEVISHCVWLYHRFCLSFRDVEELMLEQVTDLTWEELMAQEVFTPLGLTSCGFGWPAAVPGQPRGHRLRDGQLQPHDLSDGYRLRASIAPAGDVHCSVTDLARFGQAHLRGLHTESRFLSQATFRKLHDAPEGEYALGWNIQSICSQHLGSAGTFESCLIVFPAENLVVVVETNSYGVMTSEHFSDIASHLYRTFRTPL